MKKIRAIIIEDEPQAREMLETLLLKFCEGVQVIGTCVNVKEGVKMIQKLVPDLVFLDIEMPSEKGLKLFNYFDEIDFEVIFTTAYDQYAIDALKLSALDYLLKPIDLDELRLALRNFREKQYQKNINQALRYQFNIRPNLPKRIVLPSKQSYTFLELEDIMYCKADGNYTTFVTQDRKTHLVSKPIKEYADLLENFGFLRVHRSSIINPKYVKEMIRLRPIEVVMKDDARITVARNRQDFVVQELTKLY